MSDVRAREYAWRLAVDIGGTFTDVVLVNIDDARIFTAKLLTTPDDLLGAVQEGIIRVLERAGLTLPMLRSPIVHATTLVTNALIERTGARVAMVTTAGFADLLKIRDERRFEMFGLQLELPDPPVPRELIFELDERMDAEGHALRVPSEDEIERLADVLREAHPEVVCVALLNAYANDTHERLVTERLAARLGVPVSGSAAVAPIIREYPRFVTAVLNAASMPILGAYLGRFEKWLREAGFTSRALVMISNGGTVGTQVAAEHPIRAIESGPAAGALAGVWFSRRLECPRLLCFDMGGTTAKACFIEGYEAQIISILEVARSYRNLPGSGWPAAVPSIDLVEIGAGGGSIASLDAIGRVVVGPASAGAVPGPACYGRGGVRPTVTDANLLLGYIDPEAFAGEELRLEPKAATEAVGALAGSASMDATEMAAGIHEMINQAMAAAARAHATERGISLRGTPMLAFGGGGPIHACGVAELLECPTVFFPPHASVLSAFGALATPVRMDLASTSVRRVNS